MSNFQRFEGRTRLIEALEDQIALILEILSLLRVALKNAHSARDKATVQYLTRKVDYYIQRLAEVQSARQRLLRKRGS